MKRPNDAFLERIRVIQWHVTVLEKIFFKFCKNAKANGLGDREVNSSFSALLICLPGHTWVLLLSLKMTHFVSTGI